MFTYPKNILERYRVFIPLFLVPVWLVLYCNLSALTAFIVYSLCHLPTESRFTDSIFFFLYEVPKVLLLLVLIVYCVGIIRSYFSPERTRKILGNRKLLPGNILASILGIVTPFCSCSAIPLFLGFIESGIPLGVTFSFLIAAPMINEVALVLLFGLFGWQTALLYMSTGLFIAIISGYLIGKLRLERYVEPWVFEITLGNTEILQEKRPFQERLEYAYDTVKEIVGKVWAYIILGIAVGTGIHGYVPANFMSSIMGGSSWWSVPLAVLIGVPMYSNAAGIVPVIQALLEKGASLGTVLAFMMSVIGLSLPETIILKKVLKTQLIIIFIIIVATGITLVGYLFNLIY
ncbi:MAG: permease [Ignavibacteria bacterium]|nr:permease [Ignavibacteria bacterium]